jgi:acyl carrier protein
MSNFTKFINGEPYMDRQSIRAAMIEIIKGILPDEDFTDFKDNAPIRDQFDIDSMDFLDIVLALKKKYKVDVPEEDYENLTTMNNTLDYLGPKLEGFKE